MEVTVENICKGVTHKELDFDGGSCLWVLEKIGKIQGCIFGEDSLEDNLKAGGISQLIYVDYSHHQALSGVDILVYDHHHVIDRVIKDEEGDKTSLDILFDSIGLCGLDPVKVDQWRALVKSGDKKAIPDDMDMTRALKRVHAYFENDSEVYSKWFVPLIDNFFHKEPDIDSAIKIFQESLIRFIRENPDSPVKLTLRRWLDRLNNKEKLLRGLGSTPRNLLNYLAYLDEDTAISCVWYLLQGYHKDQVEFQECRKDFLKWVIEFFGNTLVISHITTNRKLPQVARYMIHNEYERKNLSPFIQEKIKKRGDIWYTINVNPRTKHFQIFINGSQEGMHNVSPEIVKAVRAEILLKRGMEVPGKEKLASDGTIEGTKPLFFNKDVSYQSILWGSLKHPNEEPALVFGNTSAQIQSRLIDIAKFTLDKDQYEDGCNPRSCKDCPKYSWQLDKCESKRKSE